ncbi:acid phosphatase [Chitinimonas lacunae]|uniref:Acid phosphatase n=1 Tax=Chitinimonas lacunae TaxID=1963018 RepID=A0ABV8MRQ1_9NEIS
MSRLIPALLLGLAMPALAAPLDRIEHIVVIYGENRGFDHLYGLFPGADGVRGLKPRQYRQTDHDGSVFKLLPAIWQEDSKQPGQIDPAFAELPRPANRPFRLDAPPYRLGLDQVTRDLVHRFYQNQEQINGGRMDRFAAVSNAGAFAMGHYNGRSMALWKLARQYTLADRFFMAAFGGSFLNHMWLACACTPSFPEAPERMRAVLDEDGVRLKRHPDSPASAVDGPPRYVRDGSITPDGYAVNTIQPPYQPSNVPPAKEGDARLTDPARPTLPPQTQRTIGDALSEKGVSWAWYGAAWNAAVAEGMQPAEVPRKVIYGDGPDSPGFQAHHQPYNYFANYAPGTAARAAHLKDGEDFVQAIDSGTLPQVAFYKPHGMLNQHPGGDLAAGDRHIAELVEKIRRGPQWRKTLVIVTYDENGGFWDHVAPPKGDRWGPGPRVPTLLISPWVRRAYADHTPYDTTSILKLLTRKFGLTPLDGVRPGAGDLTAALTEHGRRRHVHQPRR